MRIFKNKAFAKWAAQEGLTDSLLLAAVAQVEQGLLDADLGGHVVKKRIALPGRGKSGGARTLLVYKNAHKTFFVYGFAKNARANISADELKALKHLAKELLEYSDKALTQAIHQGALTEVKPHD
jgi:hypothetical protein